jgi:uncharacterized BrkB/YihY/UPF0761 family membrane protein
VGGADPDTGLDRAAGALFRLGAMAAQAPGDLAPDLATGAGLTAFLIVALMIASSYVLEYWINFYAGDYGGFGVVMAIFFWIGFTSTIIVAAARLSPALAQRRDLRSRPSADRG